MAATYPPYVNAYGNLPRLFAEIKKASVPPKFTNDFLQSALGLKSSSFRAMIPLLKRLGFLDQSNVPSQAYKDYRDDGHSKTVMARQLKSAYSELYAANEYAHKLDKDELLTKLRTLTGASAEDRVIPSVAGTFIELAKMANFEGGSASTAKKSKGEDEKESDADQKKTNSEDLLNRTRLGLSYTINLNLPATTEVEVFNAIFKSLKEHLFDEK